MNEVDNIIVKMHMPNKERYESMLFNYETTSQTDFRHGRLEPQTKTEFKKPARRRRPKYVPLKETQTLIDWKNGNVPFDLFLKPKEIVHTNPRKIQQFYAAAVDLEREEVRRTRPRVVLTPEIRLDDADEKSLQIVLGDKYLTTTKRDFRGFPNMAGKGVVSPMVPWPAPARPIQIERYAPRLVSPEWRMESVSWDGRQVRAYCDPTKEFWTHQRPMDQPKAKL